MPVTVTLRQEKITNADEFVAVSWIIAANPIGYYPLFVVSESIGDPTDERFERVATLNDLVTFAENALVKISSTGAFNGIGAVPGDILEITNAPASWLDSYLTVAKFTVVTVTNDYLIVNASVPFPTALASVAWTLRDSTEVTPRGLGTGAQCTREDTAGDTTYLRRHLNAVFTDVTSAANHVSSVSTHIQALIEDANADADQFSGEELEIF